MKQTTVKHSKIKVLIKIRKKLMMIKNNKNEIENEFSDEEMNEYMYNNSFIPSLIAVIVKEKELEIIKKENNINTIGKKYLHQTSNLEIPITFLSKSEYEKLMNNSKLNELWIQVTPAPTTSTTFQYQYSTKIGYVLGLIGNVITFAFASNIVFTKIFKKELKFKQLTPGSKDLNLNYKIILLCILSLLCLLVSWIIRIKYIYQEVPFMTSKITIYGKEILTNFGYLFSYISGSHFLSCLVEKLNGIKNIYYFVFIKSTSYIILPIIILIDIFISNNYHPVSYAIGLFMDGFIMIIFAFQGFLYLNSGRYFYHLLKMYYDEEKSEHDSITNLMTNSISPVNSSINHFLEQNKLTKYTLNVSPSM
eukprot:jgi/Orpsp1_1/1175218/evm.model.c7180000053065.1